MLNPNRVLSKAQILDHVWDYDFRGESGIVESYISYLRRKIDTDGPAPAASTPSAASATSLRLPPAGLMSPTPTPRSDRGPVARVVRQLEAVPLRTRLVAIVGTLVGAGPRSLTSLADGPADALRPAGRRRRGAAARWPARSRATALADLTSRTTGASRPTTPSSCRASSASVSPPAHRGRPPTPDLPDLSVTDPRVISGEPFTGRRPRAGPLKWRFVAGRVSSADRDVRGRHPAERPSTTRWRRLLGHDGGHRRRSRSIGSIVLAWFAVRRAFRPLDADRGHRRAPSPPATSPSASRCARPTTEVASLGAQRST